MCAGVSAKVVAANCRAASSARGIDCVKRIGEPCLRRAESARAAMQRAGMDVARAAEDLAEGLAQPQGTPPQKQEPASMLQLPPGRASHVADMD